MGYIFEPDVLHQVVRGALGQPLPQMIEAIAGELDRRYPGHILREREWILNNAGGAMGHLLLLHSSITEYLIVFGTPIGTAGHSGTASSITRPKSAFGIGISSSTAWAQS